MYESAVKCYQAKHGNRSQLRSKGQWHYNGVNVDVRSETWLPQKRDSV